MDENTFATLYSYAPILLMVLLFYLLLYRPQKKQQKKQMDMLSRLKKGTKVVTRGGIMGVVDSVKENSEQKAAQDLPFHVESECKDGKFTAQIQGRMDTITAPQLLEQFKKADGVKAIELHIEKMSYISSAGLRVLLIMYKSLDDKARFKLIGTNDSVKEMMQVTGFDQILL